VIPDLFFRGLLPQVFGGTPQIEVAESSNRPDAAILLLL